MDEFVISWLENKNTTDVLFIKYEKLWENIELIQKYMGFNENFITQFEKKKKRSSLREYLNDEGMCLANNIYGSLVSRVSDLRDC